MATERRTTNDESDEMWWVVSVNLRFRPGSGILNNRG
jgi:hypothetical protein